MVISRVCACVRTCIFVVVVVVVVVLFCFFVSLFWGGFEGDKFHWEG